MSRQLLIVGLLMAAAAALSSSSFAATHNYRFINAANASPLSDLSIFGYNPVASSAATVVVGNARFTALSSQLIRMEYSNAVGPNGTPLFENRATQTFVNRFSSSQQPFASVKTQIINGVNTTVLSTNDVTIYYQTGQPFNSQTLTATINTGSGSTTSWSYGDADNGNLLGTVRSLDELCTVSLNCTESGNIQIHDESLHCAWGVVSRGGWTTIDDTKSYIMSSVQGEWFDTNNVNTDAADVYLFGHGMNYRAAVKDYSTFSGKAPLPRKQQLGAWFTRWYDYANGDVERLVGLFEQYRLPLDVLVLDMNWHSKDDWTGFTFDKELYPDATQIPTFVHNKGLLLAANLHDADGIGVFEDKYKPMCAANGIDPTSGIAVPFAPLNAQYMHSLEDIVLKDLGIDTWWIDWQQGGWAGMCKNDAMNPTFITNHVRMTDSIRRNENVRSSILARWGGLGSQRYPVGFSGDVAQLTWECFAFQPYFSVTAANLGYGTISHDLVGPAEDHELHVRWMQFGAFSGIMRIHDRGMSAGGCWDDCPNVDIWRLPPDYFNAIRDAMLAREALLPYIYTHNRAAYDDGVPLVYPMYYDSPLASDAYLMDGTGTWAQYMFGPSMLVAPITTGKDDTTGLATKNVWLPQGLWWDDVYGALVSVTAPQGQRLLQQYDMTEIPIFYKGGAVIPRLTRFDHIAAATKPFNEVDLYIYPGASQGSAVWYDDDGQSYAYVKADPRASQYTVAYNRTADGSGISVKITSPAQQQPSVTNFTVRIVLVASQPVASVRINGATANAVISYDGPSVTATVALPAVAVNTAGGSTSVTATIALIAPQNDAAFKGLKALGYRGALAKRTLDNFRTTPYSTTVGPGMLKQMGSRGPYMTLLANQASNAANATAASLFQQLISGNGASDTIFGMPYVQLAANAVSEINSSPSPAPPGPPMRALIQLWSESRKDMLLCGSTTCLEWNSDYAVFGVEGYQLSSSSKPFAQPLNDFYSSTYDDNWADVFSAAPDSTYTIAGFSNGLVVNAAAANNTNSPYPPQSLRCLQVWKGGNDYFTFASDAALAYAKRNGYTMVSACIAYALTSVDGGAATASSSSSSSSSKHGNRHKGMKMASIKASAGAGGADEAATLQWAKNVMKRAKAMDKQLSINRPALRDRLLSSASSNALMNHGVGWSANAYASNLIQSVIPSASNNNKKKSSIPLSQKKTY